MYATTKELKKKAFRVNSQNIEQAIKILVIFILEINLQKERFLAIYDGFFRDLCVHFESLLRWECAYVCHHLRTEKEDI